MSAERLLIATKNVGKLAEIRTLLADTPYDVCSLDDFPELADIPEYGTTFEANAVQKAETGRKKTRLLTLADDSGIEVKALGNQPGVRSARFAGPDANDSDRNEKILEMLEAAGGRPRNARFRCAMAVADGAETRIFFGDVEGQLAHEQRGNNGFGYDAIFIPEGKDQTFGELPIEYKNGVSHRARALVQAIAYLKQRVSS
jgi:non-canonical purine NTP pyrophosphatase (RdgB/HAM1 family)